MTPPVFDVTVLVPTMPGREGLLAEAIASVRAQTLQPRAYLVRTEAPPNGLSPLHLAYQRTILAQQATTEWIATLDDDDLWLPHHLAALAPHATPGVDMVYGMGHDAVPYNVNDWPNQQLVTTLRTQNVMTSNALIRRSTLESMGYWRSDPDLWDPNTRTYRDNQCTWEDWDLWLRMATAGCRFRCVPEYTWVYRHGDWVRCTSN